ncbi:hypothetical protein P280DRAFT_472635 [Massarina eburnea CBS 473.64]|uniref:N-acetyltransferase domain-containing protein n=1 Tax=Massarina eburnea CBS 473.64 TaxID=1395130 RepID=A0A6A6RP24_9PLEO|nr:hypothetical protein P280DRAFT_472635 [Massarina eburnea CBS 473.64]
MPLKLLPMTTADTLSWTRVRSLAYQGPTHNLLHGNNPISESSIRSVAEDRKREIGKPNTWHWKIVDTDLSPSDDDAENNGGRTIAIAVWSLCNANATAVDTNNEAKPFIPPELRLDALEALFTPIRKAQLETMGTETPYFMLNTLATHPEHQKRGAAKLLLDWGLQKADEEGLLMYLDSSLAGRRMYEKRGFEVVREVRFDRALWGGEGIDWYGSMIRKVSRR